MKKNISIRAYPSADEDAKTAEVARETEQTRSSSYRLAYADLPFLLRDELRPVRLQLELLKPELILQEQGIESTIVVFGSSRIKKPETEKECLREAEAAYLSNSSDSDLEKQIECSRRRLRNSRYYEEARKFAHMVSANNDKQEGAHRYVIITGGGQGIMEAANRGANDAGAISIGLNIVLPTEQVPNPYITPELTFQFHYFGIRKMHFLIRARALVIFPGGFGTLDELFDALTLIQTKKIKEIPVLLFGREYWNRIINFEAMVEEGFISPEDLRIFQYVETAGEAVGIIEDFYREIFK